MSRIGIIRDAINAVHGNNHFDNYCTYYADNSNKSPNRATGDAIYKVPKWCDGLTCEQRELVVEHLKYHPEVKDAYLSRGYTEKGWRLDDNRWVVGGHLKVRFYGLARPYR